MATLANNILEVVEESHMGGFVLKYFNNTLIPLKSKKEEVQSFSDFRPISLCNTIYKIISKVMENRLKNIIDSIISLEQSEFSPNHSIYEGVIVTHEVIPSIQTSKVDRMLAKLDIRKAYDEVNQEFLFEVLKKFGFSLEWVKWVETCIKTPQFSFFVNDNPRGFSETEKGLRQGDPLSPFLLS